MQPHYYLAFDQGQRDWENCQLDDNPYDMKTETEFYDGWRDGWIAMNKRWNPNWYAARPRPKNN